MAQECPEPCITAFQADGWSCGVWCARWGERPFRRLRGEGARQPASIADARARGNEFIAKLLAASTAPAPKPKPKPKAKGKAAPKQQIEPEPESLEAALVAGQACTKFIATKMGTKGCRACTGEWFEHIRQRAHKP